MAESHHYSVLSLSLPDGSKDGANGFNPFGAVPPMADGVTSWTQKVGAKGLQLYDPLSVTVSEVSFWIREVVSTVTREPGAFSYVERGINHWGLD